VVNLQHWPAKFEKLHGSDPAALALVAIQIKALLPPLSPVGGQVVTGGRSHS
jgi:hypothetical protein